MGWKQFCTLECQKLSKQDRQRFVCITCGVAVIRTKSQLWPSGNVFCSLSCSAKYTNLHRVTRRTLEKICRQKSKPICANKRCKKQIGIDNKFYCSPECRYEAEKTIDINFVLDEIKHFHDLFDRVPMKLDLPSLCSKARRAFGSWNKAIIAAGYLPNPVRFSKKYTAKDGHPCDSLSEKIVDDWLCAHQIPHEVKVRYPWNNGMSADFKVGTYWIELFGLCGQLKSYDNLMKIKFYQTKKYNLKLISIYLSDLFPVSHLEKKFRVLTKITRNLHNDSRS